MRCYMLHSWPTRCATNQYHGAKFRHWRVTLRPLGFLLLCCQFDGGREPQKAVEITAAKRHPEIAKRTAVSSVVYNLQFAYYFIFIHIIIHIWWFLQFYISTMRWKTTCMCTDNMLYIYIYSQSCHHSWKPSTLWTGASSWQIPTNRLGWFELIQSFTTCTGLWFCLQYVSALIHRLHQTIPITKNYQLLELMTIQTSQLK